MNQQKDMFYILQKNENENSFNNLEFYFDFNIAITSFLKIIKNDIDIYIKCEINKDTIKNYINKYCIKCYLKKSNVLYNIYKCSIKSNIFIIDGDNQQVIWDKDIDFCIKNLLKSINSLLNTNSININNKIIINKKEKKKLIENKKVLTKDELKKKINEIKKQYDIKKEEIEKKRQEIQKKAKKIILEKEKINNEKKIINNEKDKNEQIIREFLASKKAFFLMKKDIDNNNHPLTEDTISDFFKQNYQIFKDLHNKNEINIDDDNENEILIQEQIKKFDNIKCNLEEINFINKFLFEKKMYYSIKDQIENGDIYDTEIPDEFRKKYDIFTILDNKNTISNNEIEFNDDTQEQIIKEFSNFVELYENKKENKYVPHNINYKSKTEEIN